MKTTYCLYSPQFSKRNMCFSSKNRKCVFQNLHGCAFSLLWQTPPQTKTNNKNKQKPTKNSNAIYASYKVKKCHCIKFRAGRTYWLETFVRLERLQIAIRKIQTGIISHRSVDVNSSPRSYN